MKTIISAILCTSLVACASSESVSSQGDGGADTTPTDPPAEIPSDQPKDDPPPPPQDDDPPPPDDTTVFAECATQYDEAQLRPLDMVVMLDRSGSMADDGKWTAATSALQQFAANPDSNGIGVSLSYFPETYSNICYACDYYCDVCFNGCCALPTGEWCWNDGDCDGGGVCYNFMCHAGGGNATCDVGDYAAPEVPLSALPAAAAQLNISMAGVSPIGGTPTGPALAGALAYAESLATQPSANDVVVVLATDGEPTECQPQAIGDVAAIAQSAANALTPIHTFVIGVGANMFNLNVIAAAGGTGAAYLVDANQNATQTFLDTLNEIRRVAVACQYQIPEVNGNIAYDLVNVAYAAEGQALTPIGQVSGPGACGVSPGWHYDDPAAPASIVMCPATCDMLQDSDDTQVEIVYGCETIIR